MIAARSSRLCVALLVGISFLCQGCRIGLRLPGLGIGIGVGNHPADLPPELEVGGIRVEEHTVEIVISKSMSYEATVETRQTVSSPLGVLVGQRASRTFDPRTQDLELLEAYVEHPDGTRIPVQRENVFTRPSEAAQESPGFVTSLTTTVVFPQLRVGAKTFVKWRFREKVWPLLGFNFLYHPELAVPVDLATIRITYPNTLSLDHAQRGGFEIRSPAGAERPGMTSIEARLEGFPGHRRELAMVSAVDVVPLFVVSSTKSWEEIGRLFHHGFRERTEVTPEIREVADRVARSRRGLRAARALYRWVSRHVHYVSVRLDSVDGWAPHPAANVLANGYGDCKDQIALLAALLRAKGIDSEPVLINSDRSFQELPIPTPLQFDHCILYLPEFDVYTDPTNPYANFGELVRRLSGKFAVHATAEGRTGHTPSGEAKENRYAVFHDLTIDAEGNVEGHTNMQLEGQTEILVREILARASTGAVLADDMLLSTPEGGTGQIISSDPTDLDEPFRCEATWTSRGALSMGEDVYFATPVGVDFVNPAIIREYITEEERAFPILAAAITISWTYTMRLPGGYVATTLPEGERVESPAGTYVSQYSGEGDDRVVVTRRLVVQKDVFDADEYPDLRDLLRAAVNDARRILVVSRAARS